MALAIRIDAALAVLAFTVLVWGPISPLWLLLGGGLFRIVLLWIVHV